jgi:hypothetical protein
MWSITQRPSSRNCIGIPVPAEGRVGAYGFSFGEVGYVFCGITGSEEGHEVLDDGWAYRPATDQWYQLGLFPGVPMASGFACSTSSTCYIGLGCSAVDDDSWVSTDYTAAFWEYQPAGLVGLVEAELGTGIRILSNTDGILVQWPSHSHPARFNLFDVHGRIVATSSLADHVGQVDCTTIGLGSGCYIVELIGGDHASRTKVLVMH